MHALIVGCGYLGRRAARRWIEDGHRVSALTRSPTNARQLTDAGIEPIVGDVLAPSTVSALPTADVMLIAITHDRASGVTKRALVVDGVANLAHEMQSRVGHVIDISSTSVYGQSDGSWVDETSPTEPTTEGGHLTLDAEIALQEICNASTSERRLTILRLAGIYGPGRLIARGRPAPQREADRRKFRGMAQPDPRGRRGPLHRHGGSGTPQLAGVARQRRTAGHARRVLFDDRPRSRRAAADI